MNKVLEILKQVGAIITDGHFVGTSGLHMPTYINKDALYPHTAETSELCKQFAEKGKDLEVDVVVGPALGGIILSQWTAYYLSQMRGKEVYGIYTEKTPNNGQQFTRGYDKFVKGKKIFVVEDLTTTGESAKKVVEAVKVAGGEVVAVSVMVNRSPKTVTAEYFGVPFLPLAEFEVPVYQPDACPLCRAGVAIDTGVGHGKEFLRNFKK